MNDLHEPAQEPSGTVTTLDGLFEMARARQSSLTVEYDRTVPGPRPYEAQLTTYRGAQVTSRFRTLTDLIDTMSSLMVGLP